MTRYGTGHKQKTHDRIVAIAARELRLQGPEKLGVSAVMGNAGLTHGGFYAHFSSKDSLITAAIARMFTDAITFLQGHLENASANEGLSAYIDSYLSPEHRDEIEKGCPVVSLASDVPRLSPQARQAFATGLRDLLAAIASCLSALGINQPERKAQSLMSEIVGALSLARAESDSERSNEILAASRQEAKVRLGLKQPV